MKKIILLIAILSSMTQLSAQEIELFATYSGSNYHKFQHNIGYGIGYHHTIKSKNKIGLSLQHSFCSMNYGEIYPSLEDGISTYIKKVDPKNQRIVFKINYAFKLVNNPKSSLFIGPEIGINYFLVSEQIQRYENEGINAGYYHLDFSRKKKFGYGFLIEFELNEIITKRISISSSIHPEITSFEKNGIDGSHLPYFIRWLNFNLGIKYELIKDKNK